MAFAVELVQYQTHQTSTLQVKKRICQTGNDVKLELKNFTFHAMSIRNLIC